MNISICRLVNSLLLAILFAFSPIVTLAGPVIEMVQTEDWVKKINADIYLIGDYHHLDISLRDTVALSLPSFKKADPKINCLFLEADERSQTIVDKYLKARSQAGSAADFGYLDYVNELDSMPANEFTQAVRHRSLIETAHRNGIRVIPADVDMTSELGAEVAKNLGPQTDYNILLDARNRHFANNVKKAFESAGCDRGLVFIGEAHLSGRSAPKDSVTLDMSLRSLGISPAIVEIVSTALVCILNDDADVDCDRKNQDSKKSSLSIRPATSGIAFRLLNGY